jgi:hypothetical protein
VSGTNDGAVRILATLAQLLLNILPNFLFSDTLRPGDKGPNFTPIKTAGKVIGLCILLFWFLDNRGR